MTNDFIFLLSLDEVIQYFGDSGQLADQNHPNNEEDGFHDQFSDARIANHTVGGSVPWGYEAESGDAWFWLLRSPGLVEGMVVTVSIDGFVDVSGQSVFPDFFGVRPALWLELHVQD